MEIEKTADALLLTTPGSPGAPARIKELEACAEKGSSICIQLPCLPLVLNRLQQVSKKVCFSICIKAERLTHELNFRKNTWKMSKSTQKSTTHLTLM